MVSDDLHNWLVYAPPNSPKSCIPFLPYVQWLKTLSSSLLTCSHSLPMLLNTQPWVCFLFSAFWPIFYFLLYLQFFD